MVFRRVVADNSTATSSAAKGEIERNQSPSSTVSSTERKLPSLSPMLFGSWKQQRKNSFCSRVSSLSGGSIGRNQENLKVSISDLNHLFGRTEAQSLLQASFVKVLRGAVGKQPSVLVHGKAGTGKTALVMQFHDAVTSTATGHFCSGGFTQSTARPFSAIIHSMDSLCMYLKEGENEDDICLRRSVLRSKMSERQLCELSDLLPSFQLILHSSSDSEEEKTLSSKPHSKESTFNGSEASAGHLASLFHTLMRILCHDSKPIVFFLDNLQWAQDETSLSFLSLLLSDSQSENLLFVGAYRDDILGELPWMKVADMKPFTDIKLENLSLDNVKDLLSDLTGKAHVLPLARIVRRKTHGNPSAIIEFLEILQREELLSYSFQTSKWSWDLELIRIKTDVMENVYQVLARRIDNMPNTNRKVLNLAAIIGFGFDPKFLVPLSWHLNLLENEYKESMTSAALMSYGRETRQPDAGPISDESKNKSRRLFYKSTLQIALQQAEVEGLIGKAKDDSRYKFSHSLVHQSLYQLSFAGQEDREKLHLRIARAMIALSAHEEECDKMFMSALDHYNRGTSSLENDSERVNVIRLNLKAAESAKLTNLWKVSTEYLETAISLLEPLTDWKNHYNLLVEAYSALAEMGFRCGKMKLSLTCYEEIQRNALCILDKLRASYVRIEIMFAQQSFDEAVEFAVAILDQLGEKINKRPKKSDLLIELRRTQKLLNIMTGPALLNMPRMTDLRQIECMRFLSLLAAVSFHASEELFTLATMRILQNSVVDGICDFTPFALAGYAVIAIETTQEAFDYGSLAMTMCERRENNNGCIAATCLTVFSFLDHLRHPLEKSLDHLLKGYQIGMQNGQVEFGANCLTSFAAVGLYSTSRLDAYMDTLEGSREQLAIHGGGLILSFIDPYKLAAENLSGRTTEVMLNDGSFDERHILKPMEHPGKKGATWCQPRFAASCFVAYIFNDIELATEARLELKKRNKWGALGLHCLAYIELFLSGLLSFARQRKRRSWRLLRQAKQIIRTMEDFGKEKNVNCNAMLLLLRAELAAMLGYESLADNLYIDAIQSFSTITLLQFQAIATERAAEFQLNVGNKSAFNTHITDAVRLYSNWGAQAKVQQLMELYNLPRNFSGGDAPPIITVHGKSS